MGSNERQVTLRIAAEDAFSQTMNELKAALAMLPQDVLANMQKTNAAFGQLKIKSSMDIELEKNKLHAAFKQISTDGTASAADIQRAYAAYRGEIANLDKQLQTVHTSQKKSTDNASGMNSVLGSMAQYVMAAFSVSAVIAFGKETFNTTLAVDAVNSKLKILTGSTKAAGQEWESVRAESERLRLDLKETEDSYSSFAVATKNTSMEGEASRRFFIGVAEAITALHLPAENGSRVLYQFQQMLSKGKVNMEDLKTASESFPGLLKMVADSLGITTAALLDQMQKGELMAADVLPKLGEQLHKTFGKAAVEEANKGRGAVNEFTTAVFNLKNTFGEASQGTSGGALGFFTGIVNKLRESIPLVQQSKIYWNSLFDKAAAWNNAGGIIGLMKGGPEARAELQAEFAAIDLQAQHAWDKTVATSKLGAQKQAGEDARNSQRRRDEAKKTGEDLAKINLAYAKVINQTEDELTAAMDKAYQERIKDVKAYYDQKKAASKSNDEEIVWEKLKTVALKNLALQHARDSEIIAAQSVQRAVDLRKEGLETEINAIKRQAVDRTITEADASRKITELTITALRDQYTTRQYVAEKIAAIYGKDSDDYKKALKEQQSSHKAYIDANFAAYKTYSDKIKNLDKEIADFRRSIAEKIADLKQKGMTDEQKYADNLARFNTAIDAAESARRQKKTEEALRYSKQAEELASRLGDTQTAEINGVKAAEEALHKVEENRVKILEGQKDEAQESLDKLKALNEQQLDPKKLEINLDEAALNRVTEEINQLTKPEKKTIMIETIGPDTDAYNASIRGMASGGRVGGSGIGDNQLRLLDPREHVLRPEATAYWGDSLLAAFNAPWTSFGQTVAARLKNSSLPHIPTVSPSFAMATGGPVGTMQDMGTLNITIGNGSFPVMGKIDVLSELRTALRREKLVRQQ